MHSGVDFEIPVDLTSNMSTGLDMDRAGTGSGALVNNLRSLIAEKETELKTIQKTGAATPRNAELSSTIQLKSDLEYKTKMLRNRTQELSTCESRLKEVESNHEQARVEVNEHKSALSKLQLQLQQSSRTTDENDERIQALENNSLRQQAGYEEELDRLRSEQQDQLQQLKDRFDAKKRELEEEIKQRTSANMTVTQEANKLRATYKNSLDEVKRATESSEQKWKNQLAQERRKVDELDAELSRLADQHKSAISSIQAHKLANSDLQNKVREGDWNLEQTDESNRRTMDQLQQLETSKADMAAEYQEKVSGLVQQLQRVQQAANAQRNEFQQDNAVLRQNLEKSKAQEAQLDQLRMHMEQELDSLNAEMNTMEQELQVRDSNIQQLQTDLEQTDRERADQQVARERVTAAEQETARMNAYMEQEIEELKGENLEQERMIAGLRRQMDEMERKLQSQHFQLTAAEKQLQTQEEAIATETERWSDRLEKQTEKLKQQKDKYKEQLEERGTEIITIKENHDEYVREAAKELTKVQVAAKTAEAQMSKQLTILESQTLELKATIGRLTDQQQQKYVQYQKDLQLQMEHLNTGGWDTTEREGYSGGDQMMQSTTSAFSVASGFEGGDYMDTMGGGGGGAARSGNPALESHFKQMKMQIELMKRERKKEKDKKKMKKLREKEKEEQKVAKEKQKEKDLRRKDMEDRLNMVYQNVVARRTATQSMVDSHHQAAAVAANAAAHAHQHRAASLEGMSMQVYAPPQPYPQATPGMLPPAPAGAPLAQSSYQAFNPALSQSAYNPALNMSAVRPDAAQSGIGANSMYYPRQF